MSANKSNLDSPDALEAFRVAMGLVSPPRAAPRAQNIESPKINMDPLVGLPTNIVEGSPSNEGSLNEEVPTAASDTEPTASDAQPTESKSQPSTETVTSNVIKCTNCGHEMDTSSSSLPKPKIPGDSHDASKDKANANKKSSTSAGIPEDDDPSITTMLRNDPYTQEEAHDVMIGIAQAFAALDTRRSPDNSPSKRPKGQNQKFVSLTPRKSNEANKISGDVQGGRSKGRQSGSSTTAQASSNTSPVRAPQNDENPSPHLSKKGSPIAIGSQDAPTQDDYTPPHLRAPKHNLVMSPLAQPSKNYYSVLDPKHQSMSSKKMRQPIFIEDSEISDQEKPKAKPTGLKSLSTSSSGSKDTNPYSYKSDDAGMGPAPVPAHVAPIAAAVEPIVDHKATAVKPETPARLTGTKAPQASFGNGKMDLPPSILAKYGMKKSPTPSKILKADEEDLEHQTIFKAWPGQEARSGPVAGIRTCHIKPIPSSANAAFVANLVFGGALEYIKVHSDPDTPNASATVRFLSVEDCKRFYDGSDNGIPYVVPGPQPLKKTAFVMLGKEVDVVSGNLSQQIDWGMTRCVRAVLVDANLNTLDLTLLAADKGRQVEGVEDGKTQTGSRSVVWRFCDVAHAAAFRGTLARHPDFESCNISFADDPCALRDGVGED